MAIFTASESSPGLVVGAAVNSTVYLLGLKVLLAGLTPVAVIQSWVLGTLVYAAFGAGGYLLVCMYFVVGSAVPFFPSPCIHYFCRNAISWILHMNAKTCNVLAGHQSETCPKAEGGNRRSPLRPQISCAFAALTLISRFHAYLVLLLAVWKLLV